MPIHHVNNEAELNVLLQTHDALVVCYYQKCNISNKLKTELKGLVDNDALQDVGVVFADIGKFNFAYVQRRAFSRLPTLSFFTGTREYERLTGYSDARSIVSAVQRLTAQGMMRA